MKIFTLSARVLLAIIIVVFVAGCGGNSPTIPPTFEYRLLLLDHIHGGKSVNEVTVVQGQKSEFWTRLEYRFRYGSEEWSPWSVVTSEEILDVTIKGQNSGDWPADIGVTPAQSRLKAGGELQVVFWPSTGGHLGSAMLMLSVARLGVSLGITVTVVAGDTNPPPVNTCDREPEPIDGFWWACEPINDGYGGKVWRNTGVPVDQPTGGFHAHGAQGEFRDGTGFVSIEQANGYRFEWYLDSSKIVSGVTFESAVLPSWCWNGAASEFITILWAEPNDPDLEDPGNMLVVPGSYQVRFNYLTAKCEGTVEVLHREGFSLKGLRVKPHPDYPSILITH